MLKNTVNGILAGILISIGGCVFLACENRYIGAVLFSVALLCICFKGYSLFTGKVGFLAEKHDKASFEIVLAALLGNTVATALLGFAVRFGIPSMYQTANAICSTKLEQTVWQTVLRGVLCGILMYLAVSIYRDKKSISPIFFCIPVFILSGFEHSIADIFYFAVSGIYSFKAFIFILVVIISNSVGGLLLPVLQSVAFKEEKNG